MHLLEIYKVLEAVMKGRNLTFSARCTDVCFADFGTIPLRLANDGCATSVWSGIMVISRCQTSHRSIAVIYLMCQAM